MLHTLFITVNIFFIYILILNFYEIEQTNYYILIVFFKTETLFSDNNTFNVNNIQLEKRIKLQIPH